MVSLLPGVLVRFFRSAGFYKVCLCSILKFRHLHDLAVELALHDELLPVQVARYSNVSVVGSVSGATVVGGF
jgi:hypothetical protein